MKDNIINNLFELWKHIDSSGQFLRGTEQYNSTKPSNNSWPSKVMKKIITPAFILLLAFSNLYAFDGERKGFILGGGIGAGFLSNTVSVGSFSLTEGEGVFITNFKIGYAPSNALEIFYVSKVSWWGESDVIFIVGLSAIAVTFYFNETSETG